MIDPLRQAEKLLDTLLPVKERTLYLCPSPLFGYGLARFLEKFPKNSALLCVEADSLLFEWTVQHIDTGLKAPSYAFLRTQDPLELCYFVRKTWGQRLFRRIEIIKTTGGYHLCENLYNTFKDTLFREIQIEWGNAMTLSRLGRLYISNAIRNMPFLARQNKTNPDFGSAPTLVVGAGPSLDVFLAFLGENKSTDNSKTQKNPPSAGTNGPRFRHFAYGKIIATDTALLPLLSRNIKPDILIALEAQHWNLKDFIGTSRHSIPLVMDLSALPATADCLGGNPRMVWTPWTELNIFSRLKTADLLPLRLEPLGSVGLSALALALSLSKGDVVCAGLDFSFSPDSYHCRGSPGQQSFLRNNTRLTSPYPTDAVFRNGTIPTLSKTGKAVRTDPALQNYQALFKAEFAGNQRVFDIEGSGLPLGCRTLSMRDAVEKLKNGKELWAQEEPAAIHEGENRPGGPLFVPEKKEKLKAFIRIEKESLIEIREILSGRRESADQRLDFLLDQTDYLWAHFPDCAGKGGRRPLSTDISFLNRIRAEIDPFLRLWEQAESDLE